MNSLWWVHCNRDFKKKSWLATGSNPSIFWPVPFGLCRHAPRQCLPQSSVCWFSVACFVTDSCCLREVQMQLLIQIELIRKIQFISCSSNGYFLNCFFVFRVVSRVLQEEVLVPLWAQIERVAVVVKELLASLDILLGLESDDDSKPKGGEELRLGFYSLGLVGDFGGEGPPTKEGKKERKFC